MRAVCVADDRSSLSDCAGCVRIASHTGSIADSPAAEAVSASSALVWPSSATTCGIYFSILQTRNVRGIAKSLPTVGSFATVYLCKRSGCPVSNGNALSGCCPSRNDAGPDPYGFSLHRDL